MPRTRLLEWPPAAAFGASPCLQVEIQPGVPAVAEVSGEIDIASASWLRETLLLAIHRHGPVIRVDLRRVTFMDCSGINALIATARRASLEGGQMQVIRPSAQAWRLIMLLSLHQAGNQGQAQGFPRG